ncbi:hypothetical protein M5K25_012099 [Dendrobium thyrsiflorum]|uniref:Uncharacterized protein n=1 Tax=Dendrobium thyrsiflorum TaxID=117978 RepID=A0ABD0UW28_DENTH
MMTLNSKVEELQQELSACQQQLQTLEKRLRFFEPDPLAVTPFMSLSELESCEKFFMESFARVSEKKNFLLVNHLPAYDMSVPSIPMFLQQSQQNGMLNQFIYDLIQEVPDSSARHNQSLFLNLDRLMPLRDQVIFEPQVGGDTWQQANGSAELLSALIPHAPLPIMQASTGMPELPSVEGAVSYSHVQVEDGTCGGENVG